MDPPLPEGCSEASLRIFRPGIIDKPLQSSQAVASGDVVTFSGVDGEPLKKETVGAAAFAGLAGLTAAPIIKVCEMDF